MKLQGLSVIFCVIAVPVILILTYYIQAQVDTIALQASYDTKLLDATHDAMVALEINTANEDLSTVSDALRSIVTASTNTFINSLSTNLGMSNASKSALQPYIPAILVTLYDGYYIYSPTKTPVICTSSDGQAVYVGDEGVEFAGTELGSDGKTYNTYKYTEGDASKTIDGPSATQVDTDFGMLLYKAEKGSVDDIYMTAVVETDNAGVNKLHTVFKTDYVLKSYIPYAARYVVGNPHTSPNSSIDVVINYTLDNFVTVYGNIKGVYYTKSGYYTNAKVTSVSGGASLATLLSYSETEIEDYCMNPANNLTIVVDVGGGANITINSSGGDDARTSIAYYLRSYIFSNWLRNNLGTLIEQNITESLSEENKESYGTTLLGGSDKFSLTNPTIVTFAGKNGVIFDKNEDPEIADSTFSLHKRDVMKNSIQYNLNLAMSLYNEMSLNSYAFNMPILDEETWDQATSRISFVTFMQGFRCGLKIYNNYAIVSSTNNEFSVIPEEIYYRGLTTVDTMNIDLDGDGTLDTYDIKQYHRVDCPIYQAELSGKTVENVLNSFISKEIKYDKIYDKLTTSYEYDHMYYACYDCIVAANYETTRSGNTGYYQDFDYGSLSSEAKKAYVIALGKERQQLYKTNQITNTQGTVTQNTGSILHPSNERIPITTSQVRKLKDIKSIEITISNVTSNTHKVDNDGNPTAEYEPHIVPVLYLDVKLNNSYSIPNKVEGVSDTMYRVVTNQKTEQTIVITFSNNPSVLNKDITLSQINLNAYLSLDPLTEDNDYRYEVKSVKINYK